MVNQTVPLTGAKERSELQIKIQKYLGEIVCLLLLIASPACAHADTDAQTLLKLHNSFRQKIGIRGLCLNQKLMTAAEKFCLYMAATDDFDHVSRNGPTPESRLDEVDYDWEMYGENIAFGQTTADEVMDAWITSPGHRENIVEPEFEEAGFARCGPADESYWVSIFGASGLRSCIH